MKRNALFFTVLLFLISSCNKYPNVNDEEVKNLAIESAKYSLVNLEFLERYLVKSALNGDDTDLNNRLNIIKSDNFSSFNYKYRFLNYIDNDKFIQSLDSAIKAKRIKIENVRIDNTSNEFKKCECSADLKIGELRYPISYSAQYSEDGKLIVQTQLK